MKRPKNRTSDKSKVEYEQAWFEIHALIRSAIERSMDDPVEILKYIQENEIKDLEKKGLIRVDLEEINFDGANPFNPSTLIAWHKA